MDPYGDFPANALSPNCRNPTTAASSSLTRSRTRSPRLLWGQTVPERHRRKLHQTCFVRTGVDSLSDILRDRSSAYSISSGYAPPFPALIETGGKTDTQSAAHARGARVETRYEQESEMSSNRRRFAFPMIVAVAAVLLFPMPARATLGRQGRRGSCRAHRLLLVRLCDA